MIYFLIGIISLYLLTRWISRRKCPREIMHYTCKGDNCDHSYKAIEDAKFNMKRRGVR